MGNENSNSNRERDKVAGFTKIMLDFMFYCGILLCLVLPLAIKIAAPFYENFETYYIQVVILYFINGILAILLVNELRKMFRTVLQDNCFVRENVASLKKMGIYAFCIAAVSAMRLLFYITPAMLLVILVFIVAGFFSLVLSDVFDKAVEYKLENDLTI